jgi:pSer/pThr/pTyr-binding forkhead associated (FHA) protein
MTVGHWLLIVRVLIALTLYAFLGSVLVLLWRDLRAASRVSEQIPYARLEQRDGDSTIGTFQLVEFNSIGRETGSTIFLDDDTVSVHHANIVYEKGQWLLEDLGSHNGTIVNEVQIEEPIVVAHGDRIRLGKVLLVLSMQKDEHDQEED